MFYLSLSLSFFVFNELKAILIRCWINSDKRIISITGLPHNSPPVVNHLKCEFFLERVQARVKKEEEEVEEKTKFSITSFDTSI